MYKRQVLSHACEGNTQNEYWEIVNNFHRRLVKQIDFPSLKSWEELLFTTQVYGSVEDIIVNSGTEIYSLCLKNMIQRLKKHNVIGSIVVMGWLPEEFRKQFFDIFLKKISSEFTDLRYNTFYYKNILIIYYINNLIKDWLIHH